MSQAPHQIGASSTYERECIECSVRLISGNLYCSVVARSHWVGRDLKAAVRSFVCEHASASTVLDALVLPDGSILRDEQEVTTLCSERILNVQAVFIQDFARAKFEKALDLVQDAVQDGASVRDQFLLTCMGVRKLLNAMQELPLDDTRIGDWLDLVDEYLRTARQMKGCSDSKFSWIKGSGWKGEKMEKPLSPQPGASRAARTHEGKLLIYHGRVYMLEGRNLEKAYTRFCHGLEIMLTILPEFDRTVEVTTFRTFIDKALDDAEMVKKALERRTRSRSRKVRRRLRMD